MSHIAVIQTSTENYHLVKEVKIWLNIQAIKLKNTIMIIFKKLIILKFY